MTSSNESALPLASEHERPRGPLAGMARGRTREAIDLMVWKGVPLEAAAAQCGLKAKSLRNAFHLASVKGYYGAQLEVLRSGEKARNIHRLVAIRDAANNMPAVNAIKALEQLEDIATASSNVQRNPGLQIVILQSATSPVLPSAPTLEHEPTVPQRLARE